MYKALQQANRYLQHAQVGIVKTNKTLERCRPLSFWCGDKTLHLREPGSYPRLFCCFTHVVGLPRHPATNEEMPLTDYQVECFERIDAETRCPDGVPLLEWLRRHHFFHLNKGRQMGFTEIFLRIIQFYCLTRYAGRNVGIISGTSIALSKKNLRRFKALYKNVPKLITERTRVTIKMVNGTIIEAFPASEEAITGDTKYACIYMDEAAKWDMVDDSPVFNSIMPLCRTNGADLFVASTPKGPVKMFFRIHRDPQEFVKLKYIIWRTEGNLYTRPEIENMLATSTEDPAQEYMGEFSIGADSVFGQITDKNRADFQPWGAKQVIAPKQVIAA